MDASNNTSPPTKPSLYMKLSMLLTGVDRKILELCPQSDWNAVAALGAIAIGTGLYLTLVFSLISYRVFASPGEFRPDLVIIAMFLAGYILAIDAYVVQRCGWVLAGIKQLKNAGLDISGGRSALIKAYLFLTFRIGFLSVPLAQLSGIFLCLLVFGGDIDSRIADANRRANAALFAPATLQVDGLIQGETEAVKAETAQAEALSAQVTTLRGNEIGPSDAATRQAEQELSQLIGQKAKADEEVTAAETVATNEFGGIRGPGTSGQPGYGLRYRAAQQRVSDARAHAQQVANDLTAARTRLDALRGQSSSSNDAAMQRAQQQVPAFEQSLDAENAKLKGMQDRLAFSIANRGNAIREAVEQSPQYVRPDKGFLAQIRVLEQLGQEDRFTGTIIILLDIASCALELAAVLAKVLGFVPTRYAALVARDGYMASVEVADEMAAELARREAKNGDVMSPDGPSGGDGENAPSPRKRCEPANDNVAPPVKRRVGRPPKHPRPPAVSNANGQGKKG
jgi:hypothetical protein